MILKFTEFINENYDKYDDKEDYELYSILDIINKQLKGAITPAHNKKEFEVNPHYNYGESVSVDIYGDDGYDIYLDYKTDELTLSLWTEDAKKYIELFKSTNLNKFIGKIKQLK